MIWVGGSNPLAPTTTNKLKSKTYLLLTPSKTVRLPSVSLIIELSKNRFYKIKNISPFHITKSNIYFNQLKVKVIIAYVDFW
jgi:hypothetical protein